MNGNHLGTTEAFKFHRRKVFEKTVPEFLWDESPTDSEIQRVPTAEGRHLLPSGPCRVENRACADVGGLILGNSFKQL